MKRETDDFTVEQKYRFAQQEGEVIAAECEKAGIPETLALFYRVRAMRLRLQYLQRAVERLASEWESDAIDIDADGDFCCAQTRRHDAERLRELDSKYRSFFRKTFPASCGKCRNLGVIGPCDEHGPLGDPVMPYEPGWCPYCGDPEAKCQAEGGCCQSARSKATGAEPHTDANAVDPHVEAQD